MDSLHNFHQSMQVAAEQLRKSLTPLLTGVQEARRTMPIELPESTRLAIRNVQGLTLGLGKIVEDAARLNPPLGQIIHEQFGPGLAARKEFVDSMQHLHLTIESLRIEPIDWSLLSGKIERPRMRKPRKKKGDE